MSGQLHLLRPFARWKWRGRSIDTVEDAMQYVSHVRSCGFLAFHTATARFPNRASELKGGSVFFVRGGVALFRMEFLRVERDSVEAWRYGGRHLIVMRSVVVRTAASPRVGFVRGWRYATDGQVPPDLPDQPDDTMPSLMRRHLDAIGVVE